MKANAKSSISLPAEELRLVRKLRVRLRLRSNVAVVRKGLRLLAETTDRQALKEAYRRASAAGRAATKEEIAAFDHLTGERVEAPLRRARTLRAKTRPCPDSASALVRATRR